MGTPGLGYSLYLFDGHRGRHKDGLNKPLNGYGIKLYDTRDMPDPPIIKSPSFSIEENAAGTVEFTLLAGARGTVMINGAGYEGEISERKNCVISDYVCYRQSELVLCRSWVMENDAVKEEEIWAGRVYAIKKDLHDNWDITAEGPLVYFNDFSAEQTKYDQGRNASYLLNHIIGKKDGNIPGLYNSTVNSVIGGGTGGSWRTITPVSGIGSFAHIDTRIYVGYVSKKLEWKAATYVSNSDNSFELSDGETYTSSLNSLLARFGGHFEITYDYETKDGPTKGRSIKYINWYADKEYRSLVSEKKIYFGLNLLDYKEDLEDTDFFTALYPIGSAQQTKETTNENGTTTKTTETVKITIEGTTVSDYHHSKESKYIYDQSLVNRYGFIEKKEKWEISSKENLKNLATKYYQDLAIGEPSITINTFDLKNLINTDLSDPRYKSVDSLYLYDQVNIVGDGAQYSHYYSKAIPIVGIKIPLDKFPTNTEYTMTNKSQRKSGLAPGNLPGTKPEDKHPDPGGDGDNTKPETDPDDTIEYLPPVGGELGIDTNMAHYPPVILRRSASRWECSAFTIEQGERHMIMFSIPEAGSSTFYDKPGSTSTVFTQDEYYNGKAWKKEMPDYMTPRYSYESQDWRANGATYSTPMSSPKYVAQNGSIVFKNAADSSVDYQTVSRDEPFIFYSDDSKSTTAAISRQINMDNNENSKYNDFYEHARVDVPTEYLVYNNPLNSYDDAYKDYYKHNEADANAAQPWRSHFTASKEDVTPKYTGETPDFKYVFINENCETGYTKAAFAASVDSAFGQFNISDIMTEIGADIIVDSSVNYFDMKLNFTHGDVDPVVIPIYRHMMDYFKSSSSTRNMGLLASWTNTEADTTVIFYSFLNGTDLSPIPFSDANRTIDEVLTNSGGSSTAININDAKELQSTYVTTITGFMTEIYDFRTNPAPDRDKLSARKSLVDKMLRYNDPWNQLSESQKEATGLKLPLPPLPNGINGLNMLHALIEYGTIGDGSIITDEAQKSVNDIFKDAIKLKLIQTMVPLMIITKTKDVGSGQEKHGLIFSGGSYKTDPNSITKVDDKFILSDDVLLSNMSGTNYVNPIMYTSDSLIDDEGSPNPLFEYDEADQSVAIKNGQIVPTPTANSSAPTLTLTKCGGVHTRQVSSGAYLVLGGPVQNQGRGFAWRTNWPAYKDSEPKGSPGARTIRHETDDSIWYLGSNMVYRKSYDVIELPETLDLSKPESGKYLEDASTLVPIAIGGDLYMKVNFVYIKNTKREDGE